MPSNSSTKFVYLFDISNSGSVEGRWWCLELHSWGGLLVQSSLQLCVVHKGRRAFVRENCRKNTCIVQYVRKRSTGGAAQNESIGVIAS
jgi:hypothetical protein